MMAPLEEIDLGRLRWNCDYNGDELGFDCLVVGYYSSEDEKYDLYINYETWEILEIWEETDE